MSSGGGDARPLASIDWRREDRLTLPRFSFVDIEREIGGVLVNIPDKRGLPGGSFALSARSALSEVDPLEEAVFSLSSFSADRFADFSPLERDGFSFLSLSLSSLRGVAVHVPQDAPPSLLIFGRDFFPDLDSRGGDVVGGSGTAGGGGGGGCSSAATLDLLLLFLSFFGDISAASGATSSSSGSSGNVPGISEDLLLFLDEAL